MDEPEINSNVTSIIMNQRGWTGKLINTTLLPEPGNTEINPVGGPGKEFWVFGTNYEEEPRGSAIASEIGDWRVEISPKTPATADYFLNVMQIMDKSINNKLDVIRIDGDLIVGVRIKDRVVIFSKTSEIIDRSFSLSITGEGVNKILLTDLLPGTWQVKKDGKVLIPAVLVRGDDGILYMEGIKGEYTFLR